MELLVATHTESPQSYHCACTDACTCRGYRRHQRVDGSVAYQPRGLSVCTYRGCTCARLRRALEHTYAQSIL